MAIQKQEFYEGAALYQLLRCCQSAQINYIAPFFVINGQIQAYLKYSTGIRSPWGFTFTTEEQSLLRAQNGSLRTVIGLVCGADGVVALPFDYYEKIAVQRDSSVRISCQRRHRESYEVSGPDGTVPGKIPPSDWQRLLTI